jgi:hypothetical protein
LRQRSVLETEVISAETSRRFMGAPLQPQDTSRMPVLQKTSKAGYMIASNATKEVLQLPLP